MARKTEGVTAKRTKKTAAPVPVRKNGEPGTYTDIEEAIRVRAYELYLERRATAGGKIGDENQDWLVAEREILSRNNGHGQHTA